ncbi:hypothetical protein [Zavarzinia aquatilis]|uniref:hypothetical protein n=1 Tax=Zavarzinia aquatilis TaxID=2211142 RepID=UPI00105784F9|nr:hypothetical protein [Zavarzinia aquatilis]
MRGDRRDFILSVLGAYCGGCICAVPRAFAQFPPARTDGPDLGPESDLNQYSSRARRAYHGCGLRSNSELQATFGGSQFGSSTGIPVLDAGLNRELDYLKRLFQVNPGVFTYADNNAFATPEKIMGHDYPDGTVVVGISLIYELFRKFQGTSSISMGDHALVGVLAHEFGHIVFFKKMQNWLSGKRPELHADFLAGWYTGCRALDIPGQVNIQEISKQMFDIGDTDFNSPSHHGTHEERLGFYTSGLRMVLQNGRVPIDAAFSEASRILGL